LSKPAIYKVYQLQDPHRLMIYIDYSRISVPEMELEGSGDYIRYVKVYPFAGDFGTVRVEVGIADYMKYKDWIDGKNIHLWVGKQSEAAPDLADADSSVGKKTGPPPTLPSESAVVRGKNTKLTTRFLAHPNSVPQATKLLDIGITSGKEIFRAIINTDGHVGAFDDFCVKNPNRLIIDIFKTNADYIEPRLKVGSSNVTAVRWGYHKGMSRVVIELAPESGPIPYYRVKRLRSGLRVTIYSPRDVKYFPSSDFTSYTVRANENLRDIARKVYGDTRVWRKIVSFNRDKFLDPDVILDSDGYLYPQADTVLRIPVR